MTVRILTAITILIALPACQTFSPAEKTPEQLAKENYVCDAKKLQMLVGEQANTNTGRLALKTSHAKTLRWTPPNSAVTMDFRQDRLNISYDEEMKILRIYCG